MEEDEEEGLRIGTYPGIEADSEEFGRESKKSGTDRCGKPENVVWEETNVQERAIRTTEKDTTRVEGKHGKAGSILPRLFCVFAISFLFLEVSFPFAHFGSFDGIFSIPCCF